MKIMVDCLPEHPKECLFSKLDTENVSPERHICKLDNKLCVYYQSGWTTRCPYLKLSEECENDKIISAVKTKAQEIMERIK